MSEGYYEAIGRILNNSFSQNKDPFDAIKQVDENEKNVQYSHFTAKENTQNLHMTGNSSQGKMEKKEAKTMRIPKVAVPKYLIEDFLTLKLPPGSSLEECKVSWKNLLKRYHPDLQASKETQDTQVIIRINNSFRRIEKWFASYNGE